MRDAGHRTPDAGHRTTDIGHRTAEKAKIIYPPPRGVDIIKYHTAGLREAKHTKRNGDRYCDFIMALNSSDAKFSEILTILSYF